MRIDIKNAMMKNIYRIKCNKYRKFENPKISGIFKKTLVLFVICNNWDDNGGKTFREEESTEMLKIN